MKKTGRDAARFLLTPDAGFGVILLHGPDAMRVALKRQHLVGVLTGPEAAEEMRVSTLGGAEIRADPAALTDALAARGFFPGRRAVVVTDAGDGIWPAVETALAGWQAGDAVAVLTAGALTPRSKLRKGVEGHGSAVAVGIYDDPMDAAEMRRQLDVAGLGALEREAEDALLALAQTLGPGDFAQTAERLALYWLGEAGPVTLEAVLAIAPATTDTATDLAVDQLAARDVGGLVVSLRRLAAQGVAPVTLCLAATRHFRALHTVASDPRSPEQAVGALRPPLFGPRRERFLRCLRGWDTARLESALAQLLQADRSLRSSRPAPATALLERVLVRIAHMGPARR